MTLHDKIRYEKEESYDEGVLFGEARGMEIGEARGMEIGEARGIMRGVTIYISSLREFEVQEEQILESVVQKFGIPREKAMELMARNL